MATPQFSLAHTSYDIMHYSIKQFIAFILYNKCYFFFLAQYNNTGLVTLFNLGFI